MKHILYEHRYYVFLAKGIFEYHDGERVQYSNPHTKEYSEYRDGRIPIQSKLRIAVMGVTPDPG
jgi:hypothetical protein